MIHTMLRLILSHHSQTDVKLRELKSIIIKYLPSDTHHNNRLTATLYDIYNCEAWLEQHALVEEEIFIPVIRRLEQKSKQNDVSVKISNMITQSPLSDEVLSREVLIQFAAVNSAMKRASYLAVAHDHVPVRDRGRRPRKR